MDVDMELSPWSKAAGFVIRMMACGRDGLKSWAREEESLNINRS